MIFIVNTFLIAILGLAFVLKPSLQELGEWNLTRFDKMSISRGSVTTIESTNERKTSIQCAAWCTDFDNCRAFQWEENLETLCTLFESNEICMDDDANDNLMLFVSQHETLCGCDEMPCGSENEYSVKEGKSCGGTSIKKWADGSSSNWGTVKGITNCKKICDLHEECDGFTHRLTDNICGHWKKALKPQSLKNHDCYIKKMNNVPDFQEMIADQKETCHTDYQIGTNTKGEGENKCKERCSANAECYYYFFSNDMNGWCALYSACHKRRFPAQSGSTFKRTTKTDDGYEFLKEGSNIACGTTERIENYRNQNVDEAWCKNKCDADKNCTYLFVSVRHQNCILYTSCDTLADYQPKNGKLFKKEFD